MFVERAILTPRNEDVNLINSKLIETFWEDVCCYEVLIQSLMIITTSTQPNF